MSRPPKTTLVVLVTVLVGGAIGFWIPLEASVPLALVIGVLGGMAAACVTGRRP